MTGIVKYDKYDTDVALVRADFPELHLCCCANCDYFSEYKGCVHCSKSFDSCEFMSGASGLCKRSGKCVKATDDCLSWEKEINFVSLEENE